MKDFIENAKVLNLSEKGTGIDKKEEELTQEKAEIKLSEKANEIVEEKGLEYSEAMSLAIDENPELAKFF